MIQVDILIKTNRTGVYQLMITTIDKDDALMTSLEISMLESNTYGGLQMATLSGSATNIDVENINILSEMTMKFKHNTDTNYHSIDTAPNEIEDLFVVIHYKLSDE